MNKPQATPPIAQDMSAPPAPAEAIQRVGDAAQATPVQSTPRSGDAAGQPVSGEVETEIQRARGTGHPLHARLQGKLEQAMGTDLSNIRIHTDARANQVSQAVKARAFTTGNDVFFRRGAYQPAHQEGQELIAHEIAHTEQQTGGAQGNQRLAKPVIQRNGDEDKDQNQNQNQNQNQDQDQDQEFDKYADILVDSMRDLGKQPRLQWMGVRPTKWNKWLNDEISQGRSDIVPTQANCWNAVLLAAYRAELIDAKYVRNASKQVERPDLGYNGMILNLAQSKSRAGEINVPEDVIKQGGEKVKDWWVDKFKNNDVDIPKGYIIHMEEKKGIGQSIHVCLSTGGGKVLELDSRGKRDIENPLYKNRDAYNEQIKVLDEMLAKLGQKEKKLKKAKKTNEVKLELRRVKHRLEELNEQKRAVPRANKEYVSVDLDNEVQERPLIDLMRNFWGVLTQRMFWAKLPSNEDIEALMKLRNK
jgi:hypothetical protein